MGACRAAHGGNSPLRAVLSTVDAPCAVCGGGDADPVWATPDRAFAVPGHYTVVRCRGCGFLYQRPRVRDEHLAACYPDHYPRHAGIEMVPGKPGGRIVWCRHQAKPRSYLWSLSALLRTRLRS